MITTDRIGCVEERLMHFYRGDIRRINHALKVWGMAKVIGQNLPDGERMVLEAAALLHDVGIREGERLYGHCTGEMQEKLGPPLAKDILEELGWSDEEITSVQFMIGHHHSYGVQGGKLLQILFEADFLVNLEEGEFKDTSPESIRDRFFQTEEGIQLWGYLFGKMD